MRSPHEDMSLEGLIADNWDDGVVHVALPFLEPYRESIEDIARDYDENTQSWRDYRSAVWSPVPEDVFEKIEEVIDSLGVPDAEIVNLIRATLSD